MMICPKCQFENREEANFCKECGAKLELFCPSCGHSYEPDSKFCDKCGHLLSDTFKPAPKDLTFDEKLAKIQKYLPGNITEKILSQRDRMSWDLARDYALYGEFFKKKGDPAQAKEKLGKAIELMRSIGADGWVKRYEEELAGLSSPFEKDEVGAKGYGEGPLTYPLTSK